MLTVDDIVHECRVATVGWRQLKSDSVKAPGWLSSNPDPSRVLPREELVLRIRVGTRTDHQRHAHRGP